MNPFCKTNPSVYPDFTTFRSHKIANPFEKPTLSVFRLYDFTTSKSHKVINSF